MSDRFGDLPFEDLIEPSIKYASEGFPVSPVTAKSWQNAFKRYKKELKGEIFKNWFEVFAPNGNAPDVGEIWKSTYHTETLKSIADTKAKSFLFWRTSSKDVKLFKKDRRLLLSGRFGKF